MITLIGIQAPAQYGKTSYVMRILNYAEDQGLHKLYLTLKDAPQTCEATSDLVLLRWLCCQSPLDWLTRVVAILQLVSIAILIVWCL